MEHEVRRELLDDVREKLGKREMKEVERHLFTPVEHCIVQVQVNGQVVNDDTDEVIMRAVDLSNAGQFNVMDMVEAHTSEHVNTRATKSNAKGITHYWIVYEEYATPLHEISWLSLVMMTLEVLDIFHRAGWVHRDISAGNIFLLQDKLFKLGDLEFAKKLGKDVSMMFERACSTSCLLEWSTKYTSLSLPT
ncbi:hypothetical protein AX14_005270, partial [Amanita brunnescens Koide BX004]